MSYGAGAAGFPSRDRAALALIFFMHILGLFAWMQQRPARLPDMPHVVSIMLRPPPQRQPRPVDAPRPPVPSRLPPIAPIGDTFSGALPPAEKPVSVKPAATPADAAAAPAVPTAPAPAPAPAVAPALEDARAPISVQDAIRDQKEADGGFGLNLSKRQAGRIDRELRNGKSGVPDEPDTPMGRFRRALEAAHIDRSKSVHYDTYTSPDGTIIYRTRTGSGSICRRSGNISPLGMSRMKMGGEAADNIPCPSGVEWKKN
jgi:hypothetical protein